MNKPNTSKALNKSVSGLDSPSSSIISNCEKFRSSYLLLGIGIFLICGIAVTYSIAVYLKHVDSALCFISHTGNYPPESCIFSVIIGFSAVTYFIIIYFRFVQISHALDEQELSTKRTKIMNTCNVTSLAFGQLGAFGLGMTGFFQHFYFHCMHLIGVILCFYFSYIFFCLQVFFTFKLNFLATNPFIKNLRISMVILAGVILLVATVLSMYTWTESETSLHPMMQVVAKEESKSDVLKTLICIEWILFIIYQIILFTFYPDLSKIKIRKDQIIIVG